MKVNSNEASLCFHRLAIMDPTQKGHQPFVDEETGNPTFDRKRFDQFKLQLDYLLGLKMANPDIVKEQIAATVLSKIVEWTPDTPNEDMLETIAWLEDRFTPLGYQPAVRLQTR